MDVQKNTDVFYATTKPKNSSRNKIEGMMQCTVIRCKGRKIRRCPGASSLFLMEADDYCTQI